MKTPYPRFAGIACRFLLTVLLFAPFAANAATTTAITYQGKLVQHGEPVEGMVDLVFRLYISAEGTHQIGTTVAANGVEVTAGVFTLLLDFGEDVFTTGAGRWLEIDVHGTTLSPRQLLTPAPMAHFAWRAGNVPGAALFWWSRDDIATLEGSARVEGSFASGRNSLASGFNSFVGGGDENTASGTDSFIGAGGENRANANGSFIGGGLVNTTNGTDSFVGGGAGNQTNAWASFIGGGILNSTSAYNSFVGGGESNLASGFNSFVGGGQSNHAEGEGSFVGGGRSAAASGERAFVGGGVLNTASGFGSSVAGGGANVASGEASFVAGGAWNTSEGVASFSAGRRAKALHDGAFVWADRLDADFASTGENQFLIRATGGVGIGTAPSRTLHIKQGVGDGILPGIQIEREPSSAWALYITDFGDFTFEYNDELKARINSADGSYIQLSDRNAKSFIRPIKNVLDKFLQLQPSSYYVNSVEHETRRSIGLIAQDVQPLFPEVVSEQEGRYGISYNGISVLNTAALIELHKQHLTLADQNRALQEQCRTLADENEKLANKNHSLEERLARLEDLIAREFAGG